MDLQDILFYIVIGFVGIISYLSQRKAKKQAEEIERRRRQQQETAAEDTLVIDYREDNPPVFTQHKEETGELSLDEIFKALRERKPLPASKPLRPQAQGLIETAPPTIPTQTTKPSVTIQETIAKVSQPEQVSSNGTNIQPINTEKHTNGYKSINWREAFIASEILNRKY